MSYIITMGNGGGLGLPRRFIGCKPNRHSWLQFLLRFQGVHADKKTIEIVIADSAGRLPGRKFAQWTQFRDAPADRGSLRSQQLHGYG
jgi:hypothetical protein